MTWLDGDDTVLSKKEALEIPTVSACVGKIGETISRLPVKLYRKDGEEVTEITDDCRIPLLNGETGDTLSTVDMWKAVIEDYFLGGGGWIFVDSDGLNVRSLRYVDSGCVSFMTNSDPIFKAFRVLVNGQKYYDFQFIRLLRKTHDGWNNITLQAENARVLSAALNSLRLENTMNENGGCKPGFLKSKNHIADQAIDRIKQGYRRVFGNRDTKGEILVLNDGIDFEPVSATAAELQMNENKRANSIEICKLFGFPHTVIDGGATEDDNRKFIAAVVAMLNQIETALDSVLLLESEKEQGFYWAFDTKELTRGSMLERYQAYEIARRNNILQIDEIRREEDYEPLGFNFITLNLSDVLLNPETMEVFTPNTGQTQSLEKGEVRARGDNWTKGDKGLFTGSKGSGGGSSGSGGGKSGKKVDKSGDSGIIKITEKGLIITKSQFGKKIAKHAAEFGLDPADKASRDKVIDIITDIYDNPDLVVNGVWRGQGKNYENGKGNTSGNVTFHIKGKSVIVSNNSIFVTVMADALDNGSVKKAIENHRKEKG